jgi:antibiotic biosynthesis monooxygenase (ABM) superfamily enzyme
LPSKLGEPAPPRYKMALVTWLAVFPVVAVIFSLFGQWLSLLPTLVRTLVFTVVMVMLMTYVIMPRMTRLFAFWLYPLRGASRLARMLVRLQAAAPRRVGILSAATPP